MALKVPQNAETAAGLSSKRPHAQLAAKGTGASALRDSLLYVLSFNPDSAALSGRVPLGTFPGLKAA